jgi:ElaB/YqjD/DUF883 family membrane-anchored ribosome-binding protein
MPGRTDPQPTLEEQIATLQAQLAALLETGAATASTAAREAKSAGAAAAGAARERAGLATAGIAEEIRAHPLPSIGIALAVGWLVGRFASR